MRDRVLGTAILGRDLDPTFPPDEKYDLKSKHCGAQSDLGTTRAKVVEALTEVRRAKIDGPALIFDDQLCELHSSNTDASTSASSRSMPNVLGKGSDF
jgi:hypothetical protein